MPIASCGRGAGHPITYKCDITLISWLSIVDSCGHGGSWPQPGDPLAGQPTAYLLRVAASAIAEAEAPEHAVAGALRVDTDGLTVEETADLIAARTRSARG
jgi:hypothetical protein